jgi:hypothetical protein
MDDLGQLFRLFEIGRMGRSDLEGLVADMDGGNLGATSLDEIEPIARASAEVFNVERLLERSARSKAGGGRGGGRMGSVTIDWDSYERSRGVLVGVAEEHARREELLEAARGRLRHFEKRDGFLYRPAGKTPLERYCGLLERRG